MPEPEPASPRGCNRLERTGETPASRSHLDTVAYRLKQRTGIAEDTAQAIELGARWQHAPGFQKTVGRLADAKPLRCLAPRQPRLHPPHS